MKRLLTLLVVAGLASLGTLRAADESKPQPRPQANWGPGPGMRGNELENLEKTVTLTDAQKTAIGALIEARTKALTEFQTTNKDKFDAARKGMMEAYQSKDKAAIAKAQKEMQAVYAPAQEIMKNSQAEIDKVLTAEQLDKVDQARAQGLIKMLTAPVQLSEEQTKKLTAVFKDAKGEEPYRKMNEAIQKMLTPEQKTTIAKSRLTGFVHALSERLKFTDEQSKKADALVEELAKEPGANPGETMSKLREKIEALLTDEQKETLKQQGVGGGFNQRPVAAPATPK